MNDKVAIEVRKAALEDLDLLVPLFDGYRQFYRLPSDPERARQFLRDRLDRGESTVFLAFYAGNAIGFTQLYPSFSSGAMKRVLILNDLFVTSAARRRGAGSALLEAAASYGRQVEAIRLVLSTEVTNGTAQALYERSGWVRDTVFCSYQFTL